MLQGAFEPEERLFFCNTCRRRTFFVDVGANVGYYTLLALKHGKHAVAWNPSPATSSACTRASRPNRWEDRAEIFPVGLAPQPGTATLYGASGPSASIVRNWAKYGSGYRQTIPVLTLDIVLATGSSIEPVHQDRRRRLRVSGLAGASRTAGRMPRVTWLIEICFDEYHPSGRNPDFSDTFGGSGAAVTRREPPMQRGPGCSRRTSNAGAGSENATPGPSTTCSASPPPGRADHHASKRDREQRVHAAAVEDDDPFLELHQLPLRRMRSR